MRQDRRFRPGEAVTSRTFAGLISSSFDRLVTVDLHLHRYPALEATYALPKMTPHAAPVPAHWITAEVRNPMQVGPAEASDQWESDITARHGAPPGHVGKV